MNVPNLITLARFPLLLGIVLLLYWAGPSGQFIAAGAIAVLILLDSLDGLLARRWRQETLLGSALDIAADRTVEVVLWIVYAHQGLIPVLIPVLVVVRGMLTDAIRSMAFQHGYSAHEMMRTRLGHWLVASPPMRTGYALSKAAAFVLLAVVRGLGGRVVSPILWTATMLVSWLSLGLCLVRGLPVLVEAPRLLQSLKESTGNGG